MVLENSSLKSKIKFLLLKNMTSKIILRSSFIHQIMPFLVIDKGIVIEKLGEKIVFNFIKKLVFKNLNLVKNKEKQINFLSKEIIFKRIGQ